MREYVGADYHERFLGEPLQRNGASALTSLGLSSKDPSELVGVDVGFLDMPKIGVFIFRA